MSSLLNKIRGTESTAKADMENDTGAIGPDMRRSGMSSTGATGTTHGYSSGSTGVTSGSTGMSSGMTGHNVGTTTATTQSSGMTGTGHAHVHGGEATVNTAFQHNAQVHFSGHADSHIQTESSATNVQVPGQHITATLPAKRVVVEVPERQVEIDLPARNIQLENNPEIEVTTRPNIRSVGAAVVNEAESMLGMNKGTSGSRVDPKTSSY